MRSGSDRVMKLHEKVEKLRESEEIGVRFMNAWEEKLLDRQDGYEEGLEEGLAVGEKRGRIAGRKTGLAEGRLSGLAEGRESGLAEGRKLGESQSKAQIAARMKSKGMTTEDISEITGLTEDEIAAL